MFLGRPERTPYDLSWRMFGIPIRVHPFFWVLCALLGWSWVDLGLEFLLIWIGCVFVSILLHELGHVWMGQIFGSRGEILLYSFGGLAFGSYDFRERWKRIAVSAAGPGIQFLLLGALWLLIELGTLPSSRLLLTAVGMLCWINLIWPLFNLLPIWPLDGGQITREVAGYFSPRSGTKIALQLSIIFAVLIAVYAIIGQLNPDRALSFEIGGYGVTLAGYYLAILFAMLAVTNIQALQFENERERWDESAW